MKLAATAEGNLLVSEATVQLNTGRVSIIDRGGARRTLLAGLPSGPGFPGNTPLGPGALVLDGRTLYISILEGNSLVAGPPGGHPLANPNGPGSPIFSTILRVRLSADVDRIMTGFSLDLDDHFALADGLEVAVSNSDGQSATIDRLAILNAIPLDRLEVYGHTTPYGMALDPAREFLYVADAGQNRLIKVDVASGRWQTLVRFPRLPRVPPAGTVTETDSVPSSARFRGDEVLVSFLTGAPFADGQATISTVNPQTRQIGPFITGLRTVTDFLYRDTPAGPQFFVCEFRSTLVGAPGSGRVIFYNSPQGRVVAEGLQGPTGLAQDPATGDVFVTEFLAGRITRIRLQ